MSIFSCGIDFGTSNSAIAVAAAELLPRLVVLDNGKQTLPSTIFYKDENLQPLFGDAANDAYMSGARGRFMRSLKRVLGTDLMGSGTLINSRLYRFSDILAAYLKHLKNQAEASVGTEIENVVMGRPVHFRDNDPKGDARAQNELETIARSLGFKNIHFQFEPIAAAFAHEDKLEKEMLACVVDIGGGTSDFTVIRLGKTLRNKSDRRDDILASSGVRIGGNDFDKQLSLKCFMPELGYKTSYGPQNLPVPSSQYFELAEWSKINSAYSYANRKIVTEVLANAHDAERYSRLLDVIDKESGHRLLHEVENAKIELTGNEEYSAGLSYISGCPVVKTTGSAFEESISKEIAKISQTLHNCLKEAGVGKEDIGLVILTGGSTEIPLLQKTMHEYFPHALFSSENKLSSVGLGLAYDSRRSFI